MLFLLFAIAVIAWSVAAFLGKAKWMSWIVLVAAIASMWSDLRAIHFARSAAKSDLEIRIIRRGDWWQLNYSRSGVSFTTANELHLPAHTRFKLSWSDARPLWFSKHGARLISIWPPMWRRLPIITQSSRDFDRWFANEARPAHANGDHFRDAGCAYCHVIRGVVNEPSTIAPDLTHFASRATIAALQVPNRRGPLMGWIAHSRGLKSGSEMPDNALPGDELQTIAGFLESLR